MKSTEYIVFNNYAKEVMRYNVPSSSKYSSALSVIKGYEKEKMQVYIVCQDTQEVITKRECEYMLK